MEANDENEGEFESGSSGDELTEDESSEVVNVIEPIKAKLIEPKEAPTDKKEFENLSGDDADMDDAKVEVKSTDEKEHEMDFDTNVSPSASTQIDANQHSNDESIFTIVSRIENNLDNLMREQVNEKRMYAIILLMLFDLLEDISRYKLDLGDVDLYLKFVSFLTF